MMKEGAVGTRGSQSNDSGQKRGSSGRNIIPDPDILRGQYDVAVDLYKHEDLLNWQKLYNLFYVSGALLLILGFISEQVDNFPADVNPFMLGFVSLVGTLMSLFFTISIWCGVNYLLSRKEKVIEIEDKLSTFGGVYIVGSDSDSQGMDRVQKAYVYKISPTTKILKTIPILFTIGWSLLICYSIIISL